MKYTIFILLILSLNVFSQGTPSSFWQNKCEYKTDGTGKSLGLKIKLAVPCEWKAKDGVRPHIVQKFSADLTDSNLLTELLTIKKLPSIPSKVDIEAFYSEKGLKELCVGTFISGRKVKIDGIDCGELVSKNEVENPVGKFYFYSIAYYFLYKDKLISLEFTIGSLNDGKSKQSFEIHKFLFRGLANDTVFLSQY